MRVLAAGAQRPLAGEKVCGDVFTVASHAESTIVCLAGGLGHGPAAHEASEPPAATCARTPGRRSTS